MCHCEEQAHQRNNKGRRPQEENTSNQLITSRRYLQPIPRLQRPTIHDSASHPLMRRASRPNSRQICQLSKGSCFLRAEQHRRKISQREEMRTIFLLSTSNLLLCPSRRSSQGRPNLSKENRRRQRRYNRNHLNKVCICHYRPIYSGKVLRESVLTRDASLSRATITGRTFYQIFQHVRRTIHPSSPSIYRCRNEACSRPHPRLPSLCRNVSKIINRFQGSSHFNTILHIRRLSKVTNNLSTDVCVRVVIDRLCEFNWNWELGVLNCWFGIWDAVLSAVLLRTTTKVNVTGVKTAVKTKFTTVNTNVNVNLVKGKTIRTVNHRPSTTNRVHASVLVVKTLIRNITLFTVIMYFLTLFRWGMANCIVVGAKFKASILSSHFVQSYLYRPFRVQVSYRRRNDKAARDLRQRLS